MAFVQREQAGGAEPSGEQNDGCIRQAEVQLRVAIDDVGSFRNVIGTERLEAVGTSRDLAQKRQLRLRAHSSGDHVVELCQDEGGKHERTLVSLKGGGRVPVE